MNIRYEGNFQIYILNLQGWFLTEDGNIVRSKNTYTTTEGFRLFYCGGKKNILKLKYYFGDVHTVHTFLHSVRLRFSGMLRRLNDSRRRYSNDG